MSGEPKPLRVGVIGVGWAGEEHLRCYKRLPNVEVVALADPRPERAQQVAELHDVPYVYADFEELARNPTIDAISIATPNSLHAPAAIAALESGKHVLSEKPLARTAAEAETMVRAAIAHDRVLKVCFNHRERGDVRVLKRYMDTGALGQVYHAKAYWMRRSGIPGLGGWFTNKELAGGGPLIDLGVHILDLAMYLMGEPKIVAVSGMTYAQLGPRGRGGSRPDQVIVGEGRYEVEDLATAFIRLENGVTLLLEASWAVYGRQWDDFGVVLYGSDAGAQIDIRNYASEDTLRIFTDTGGVPAEIAPRVGKGEGHFAVVRDFVSILRDGNSDWEQHRGRDGLRRAQIIDAIYQSALEGRELALTDVAASL